MTIISKYTFVFVWLLLVAILFKNIKVYKQQTVCGEVVNRWQFVFALIAFLPVIYFAAFTQPRSDTVLYLHIYDKIQPTLKYLQNMLLEGNEKGWAVFQWLIKVIFGNNNQIFRIILVSIHCIPVLFFFRKYSTDYLMSLYLFLAAGNHFAWMMNGIRQYIAVSIIMAAVPLMLKKKYLPLVLIILFASTFHTSALIMLPIVFIAQGEPWNKKTLFFILLAVIFTYIFSQDTGVLNSMFENTHYENSIANAINEGDDGVNPLRVLVYAVPAILAFIGRKKISKCNNQIINLSVNMSIITACIYLIAMVTSGILIGRLTIYTSLFGFVLLPYLIREIFEPKAAKFVNAAMVVLYFLYYYLERGI